MIFVSVCSVDLPVLEPRSEIEQATEVVRKTTQMSTIGKMYSRNRANSNFTGLCRHGDQTERACISRLRRRSASLDGAGKGDLESDGVQNADRRVEMTSQGRRTFLVVSGLVVLYAGFRIAPGLWREELVFEELDDPIGFRRLTAGKSSSGFDPFFALGDQTANNQADTAFKVRSNICATLYGDTFGAGQEVPIASFSDYYCPYCRVQTKRLAAMEARPASGINVVWHELPLLGETSILAAKAALAARNQGAYPAFHERLMKSPFQATPEYLQALADDIGIDHEQLATDMNGEDVLRDLENSAALARIFAFIGTPAMVIGRTVIQGEVNERTIRDVVAREREEGWASVCQKT